jgi:FSR family fosmidomycin resistance protein-like MFS transporter
MSSLRPAAATVPAAATPRPVVAGVLAAITSSHLINDMMQSLILAL